MTEFKKRVSKNISKLSPEQIDRIFKEVIEENDSFFAILDSLSTGLLILDRDGFLIASNKSSERLLQFKNHPDEARGERIEVWNVILENEISVFLKNTVTEKKTNTSKEFTVSTSGGTIRFLKIEISPFVKHRELCGSIVKIEDITSSKNSEILAHRMENMASLTNLAASMAHEIKNPLGAISIHIQLLQKILKKARASDGVLPEEKFVEKNLEVMNEEIERLNKTVVDFLFAVRPVNANLELKDPSILLEDAASFFKAELDEHKINLKIDVEKNDTHLLLDAKLFRQIIFNFAQNSIAAIKEKRDRKDVKILNKSLKNNTKSDFFEIKSFTGSDGEKYFIEISDSGCGMTEETAAKIFEPYFTTKADGTGLGMTTVYKIIKEFGGEISVSSKVMEGTVFTVELPVPQTDKKLLPGA